MQIAVLGTGHMATTLAAGLLHSGHGVTFGSRHPDQHAGLAAPVATHAGAIAGSDLVLNALAASASLTTLGGLRGALAGHVLLDIGNAVDQTMDLLYPDSSLGERLQEALPYTRVVKTLNTLGGTITVDPNRLPLATTVFLCGNDPAAKALVGDLLGDLGWATDTRIDLGGISTSRALEHYFLLFAALMGALRTPDFNIKVVVAT